MAVAKLLVLIGSMIVALFRRRMVQDARASFVPREMHAMPRRYQASILLGFVLAWALPAIARLLSDSPSLDPGAHSTGVSDLGFIVAFSFMGTANLLDALRIRQLTRPTRCVDPGA
jgi:uncharacterized membrane protein